MQVPCIFTISTRTLQSLRQMNVALFVNFSVAIFVFIFYVAMLPFDPVDGWILYTALVIGTGLITLLRHRLMSRACKQQLLIIGEKGIYHKRRNAVTRVEHRSITHIVIKVERDGEWLEMKLYSPNGVLKLQGFENMKRAYEAIRTRLNELVVVRRKRSLWQTYLGLWTNLSLSLVGLVVISLYLYAYPVVLIAHYIAWVIAAVILWTIGPMSSVWGKRARKWEWLSGALILLFVGIGLYR